ncbi:MAG TPA: formate dehydrogenase subunit gamma [Dehalococcoidia bacterium]|nr:formate dehydrogenase subunit gamma [Dehalococcoidia bacterium]
MTAQAWSEIRAQQRIDELKHLDGAALPILHALQAEFGYIDDAAIPLIAEALNLSRAEVVGVAHFYHDFRHEPPGRHILKVCRAEACQSMGSEALVRHVSQNLGIAAGETTSDGAVSFEAVYCLGNCALSPAVMLDDRLHGRVSPRRIHELLAEARA